MQPTSATVPPMARDVPAARVRLWDLPSHLLCSIVGTCLSTGELRRILGRAATAALSDVEVHTAGVAQAGDRATGKAIQKALDDRHATWVKRLGRSADPATLNAAWDAALASGDIPGAYWAVMSHANTDGALTKRAFGDVHMLSHLVGSSNRADLRKLALLERERAALAERFDRQQARLHGVIGERDAIHARLNAILIERAHVDACESDAHAMTDANVDEVRALRALVDAQEKRLVRSEQHRQAADNRMVAMRDRLAAARDAAATARAERAALQKEIDALERLREPAAAAFELESRTVLYVGGQPGTIAAMQRLVVDHGGTWLHHDGGIEERAGLLAGLVHRCDIALFPVDCVSHEAALAVKRLCRQADRPFLALRSAGLSSLVAALAKDATSSSVA